MAENDDLEIDPAIAEAMGFSSFGMQPGKRRKLNANTAFLDPKATSSGGHGESKETNAMDSDNSVMRSSTGSYALPQGMSPSAAGEESAQQKHGEGGAAGSTAATKSTASATNIDGDDERSLQALAYGVRNENGDMVYFLPSFIEDPWQDLKPQ